MIASGIQVTANKLRLECPIVHHCFIVLERRYVLFLALIEHMAVHSICIHFPVTILLQLSMLSSPNVNVQVLVRHQCTSSHEYDIQNTTDSR